MSTGDTLVLLLLGGGYSGLIWSLGEYRGYSSVITHWRGIQWAYLELRRVQGIL